MYLLITQGLLPCPYPNQFLAYMKINGWQTITQDKDFVEMFVKQRHQSIHARVPLLPKAKEYPNHCQKLLDILASSIGSNTHDVLTSIMHVAENHPILIARIQQNLKHFRKLKGYSQRQTAILAQLTVNTVSKAESVGTSSIETLLKLCQVYDVHPSILFNHISPLPEDKPLRAIYNRMKMSEWPLLTKEQKEYMSRLERMRIAQD